jgi:integrase
MTSTNITKRNMKRKQRNGETIILTRYVLSYRNPKTGARTQKFFKLQKAAQAAQSQLLVDVKEGTYSNRREAPTIEEAFNRWMEDRRGQVKESTFASYERYRPYIVGPLLIGSKEQRTEYTMTGKLPEECTLRDMLGKIKVTELTTAEIRTWYKCVADNVGSHSANKGRLYLQTLLSQAAEDYNIRPPRDKKAILLPDQVRTLLERAKKDQDYGLYYAFPFLTGVRPSEQLGLLWEDVDLDNRVINIRRMQERDGSITNFTKTTAGTRTIPMSTLLHTMLLDWRVRCPRKDGELHRVFPNLGFLAQWPHPRKCGGNALLYSNFRSRIWRRAMKQAGLPYVTPHSARHCFISTLQAQKVEVGLVAKLAGHANAVVTLSHYTQAVRGGEDAVEKLAAAFSS